jgi:hypothetical protein
MFTADRAKNNFYPVSLKGEIVKAYDETAYNIDLPVPSALL